MPRLAGTPGGECGLSRSAAQNLLERLEVVRSGGQREPVQRLGEFVDVPSVGRCAPLSQPNWVRPAQGCVRDGACRPQERLASLTCPPVRFVSPLQWSQMPGDIDTTEKRTFSVAAWTASGRGRGIGTGPTGQGAFRLSRGISELLVPLPNPTPLERVRFGHRGYRSGHLSERARVGRTRRWAPSTMLGTAWETAT